MEKIEASGNVNEELQKAIDEGAALRQMFQAGFVDGFRNGNMDKRTDKRLWEILSEDCKKAFLARFEKRINRKLKNGKNKSFKS